MMIHRGLRSIELLHDYDFSDRLSEALMQGLAYFGLQVGRRNLDKLKGGVPVFKTISQAAIHILVEHFDGVLSIESCLCDFERKSKLDLNRMQYLVIGKQLFINFHLLLLLLQFQLHLFILFLGLLLHGLLFFLFVFLSHHGSLVLLILLLYYLLLLGLTGLGCFSRDEPCIEICHPVIRIGYINRMVIVGEIVLVGMPIGDK